MENNQDNHKKQEQIVDVNIPQHNIDLELFDPKTKLAKYAVYLPALSTFFAKYIGRQRYKLRGYIEDARIPKLFNNGIEGLNWLNKKEGYFYYSSFLYSAGHADLTCQSESEAMIFQRDKKNTMCLCDSGGFQIGKGVWSADWKDPNCPKALEKRQQVLNFAEMTGDYCMALDVPPWICKTEKAKLASGINSYADAVNATQINNEYFIKNRQGNCKFLNVLQGNTHTEAEDWYSRMKQYCDPKKYENPFNGWSYGSQTSADPHLALKMLVQQRFDGLLEEGIHDWVHFLGNSNLEWSLLLSDVQRSIRKYHNPKLTISYDCATPFLSTTFATIYYKLFDFTKDDWTFFVSPSIDDKKYASDMRSLKDILEQDGIFDQFIDSPISARLTGHDICPYGPGMLNKLGKIGRTSWDSPSYALQMAHNVWMHIMTVIESNKKYDSGVYPAALTTRSHGKKNMLYYDRSFCKDIIDDIFATSDYDKAMKLIEHYSKYWMQFSGTPSRNIGPKSKNSLTAFDNIFS